MTTTAPTAPARRLWEPRVPRAALTLVLGPAGSGKSLLVAALVAAETTGHPDVVFVTRKWNRWQHHVDYRRFAANILRRREPDRDYGEVDDYGMRLVSVAPKTSPRGFNLAPIPVGEPR